MQKPLSCLSAVAVVGLLCLANSTVKGQDRDQYAAARARMVSEYVEPEGVTNERVLESMRTVPRHLFVRPRLRSAAYFDQALDIGYKQTISPPFIVAYMTQTLDPQPTDKVLEIGTGSGYQAAVLSSLVADVYTIEIVEPLGKRAAALLDRLGYKNVHTRIGDGYLGWPEEAPFDKIIVTCSPENVPPKLIEQLKEGGKMIIPIGERYQQVFHLLEKKDGELIRTRLLPTLFVPMTGKMEELRQTKPDPLHPALVNGGFEKDKNEDGLADGWHYQRRSHLSEEAFAGHQCLEFQNDEVGRMAHMLQAFAVDGSHVHDLQLGWANHYHDLVPGPAPQAQPGIVIYFFDAKRLPIGRFATRPWLGDQDDWEQTTLQVPVPLTAKEAILQAGLNGATGDLWMDEISIAPLAN